MTVFNAEKYVSENSYNLSLTDYSNIGLKLRCISDRASNFESKEHPIAVPGAGLGLVMDILGACTLLRRGGKQLTFEVGEVINATVKAIGVITFHTDEKSVRNRGLACGGCSHCNGALSDPTKYLLSESDAKYFIEQGLEQLKGLLKERGEKSAVYAGHHQARAVLTVTGTDIGLPSIGKSLDQVYVYHKDFHSLLLELMAHELMPLLASHSQGVSEQILIDAAGESARIRLEVTLEKLAKDLPTFVVSNKAHLTVEKV